MHSRERLDSCSVCVCVKRSSIDRNLLRRCIFLFYACVIVNREPSIDWLFSQQSFVLEYLACDVTSGNCC